MKKKYMIGWEKWIDPFETEHDPEINEPNNEDEDSTYEEYDPMSGMGIDAMLNKHITKHTVPVLMTPAGMLPVNDNIRPSNTFNFWIGHTNFRLTQNVIDIIEKVDGVEILDICTPYRLRLGIGRMFEGNKVKYDILTQVDEYLSYKEKYINALQEQSSEDY